jgi:MATE family multidrug resistance protein
MSEPGATKDPQQAQTTEGALVQGSLWRAIWTMSWPLMLTTVSVSIIGLVDMYCAGTISAASQAAVGVSEQILFLFMVFIMSVSVGTTALVSRAAGAGDMKEACKSSAQSISLSLAMGLILSVISLTCARFGLQAFSEAHDATVLAQGYLGVYSLYLIPFSVISIINAAFRAIGDAKTPLLIVACVTVVNILGDFATVFWNWPVSGLGIRGIALSGITGSALGASLGLFFLSRSPLKNSLSHLWPLSFSYVERTLKVGVPSGLQRLGWSLSVFVLFKILARCLHPTQAIAAWTIGMRLESLLFMPLMALSLAVSSIVGQNLGAHRVDRAFDAGWKVTGIGIMMMIILGALMFTFAPVLAHLMTKDQYAVAYVTDYMRINAISEPFLALTMILGGALQGAGDTRTPMLITVASHWIFRLPLAYMIALTLNHGPIGVWISMSLSSLVSASLTTWRFQSKAWVKTKV